MNVEGAREAQPFISHSTQEPIPPQQTAKIAQWANTSRIFNLISTLFTGLATGSFAAFYLSLPLPHVAIAVGAVMLITQIVLYVLRKCFGNPSAVVNREIPLEDLSKPAIEKAIPPHVKQYMQWFQEANKIKTSDNFVTNHDALMDYCGRYGLRVLSWAKECKVELTPQDQVYKDLVEVFFNHLSHHFLPNADQMESSFQRKPEDFLQDLQSVAEPFFTSKEHAIQVKMILLNKKRAQAGGKPSDEQFKKDLLEATSIINEAFKEDTQKILTEENQEKMALLLHETCKKVNQHELEQLRPELIEILGEKTANEAIEEGVLVSSDIRLGLSLLTPQGKEFILRTARDMKVHMTQANKDMDKLRFSIMQSMPADPKAIFSCLPSLKHLHQLPGEEGKRLREQFNTIVNRMYLNSQMKDRGSFFHGLQTEQFILKTLNYANVETYDGKIREGYLLLQEMMENMLPPVIIGRIHPNHLRKQLKQMAFETRLQAVGVDKKHHEHIKILIASVDHIQQALYEKYGKNAGRLTTLHDRAAFERKLPKALKSLEETKDTYFQSWCRQYAEHLVEAEKDWILANLHLSPSEFKAQWEENEKNYIALPAHADNLKDSVVEENLNDQIEFNREFLKDGISVVEYSQGEEGSGTILGRGICRAKTFDLERQLLQDPRKPLKDLNIDSATADQRFIQAEYSVVFKTHKDRISHQRRLIPQKVLKHYNVKESHSEFVSTVDQLIAYLKTQYVPLQKTNPSLSITVGDADAAHQIAIRFDHENKRFIFYDTNHLIAECNKGEEWLENILRKWKTAYWNDATSFACVHLTKA